VSALDDIGTRIAKFRPWMLIKETALAFVSDEALSRGARHRPLHRDLLTIVRNIR